MPNDIFYKLLFVLLLVTGAAPLPALAKSVCVADAQSIEDALAASEAQTADYTIRIVQGAYFFGAGPALSYLPNHRLFIEGGYTANCAARSVDAANTSLYLGGGTLDLLQPDASPIAQIGIDGLSIVNAANISLQAGDYGLIQDSYGRVDITRSRISNIHPGPVGYVPVALKAVDSVVSLQNVEFDRLQPVGGTCSIAITLEGTAQAALNFVTADFAASGTHDLCVKTGVSSHGNNSVRIDNSILWSSDQNAFAVRGTNAQNGTFTLTAVDSIFPGFAGAGTRHTNQVFYADPLWINPVQGNYTLAANSPAINIGDSNPVGGVPAHDISSHPRWVGSLPDLGAYESPYVGLNTASLFVSTLADSGPGSLRQALLDANALPAATASSIAFNIPHACPALIALNSNLPAINRQVVIDGYTQPGSIPNGSADAFDATICVGLTSAAGTLTRGFAVPADADPNASLTLRGFGIGGFGQGVVLLGGHNHVIAGNVFGGSLGLIGLPANGLSGITIGVAANGSLIVGGQSVADRNVIANTQANSLGNGINVQSDVSSSPDRCQILGNLIGLDVDGLTNLPNNRGIVLAGSGCAVVDNRIAANVGDAIWINGGNQNLVQRNIIGLAIDGAPRLSSGVGIRIEGNDNTIGPAPVGDVGGNYTFLANTVTDMAQGGVSVESGVRNSVRGNAIYGNGAGGPGLDIDLGAAGPLANDQYDTDGGANTLMNFPVVTGLFVLGVAPAPVADVPAVLTATLQPNVPGNYRIDAYESIGCDGARGHAERFLGSHLVTMPAGATMVTFAQSIVLSTLSQTRYIALTATDSQNDTSEIGTCFQVSAAIYDGIFKNGFN